MILFLQFPWKLSSINSNLGRGSEIFLWFVCEKVYIMSEKKRDELNLAIGKTVLQLFLWVYSPGSAVLLSNSVALQFKMQVMVRFYAMLITEFMFRLQGPLQPSASFVVTETRNMTFTKSLQASDPDQSEVLQCLALLVQQQMLSVVSFASIIMHQQLLTLWDPGGDPYLLYRYKSLGGLLTLDMIYIVSMLVYIWLLTVHSCLLSMPDAEIQVKEKLCPCLTLIYRMLIFLLSPPAKAKHQDINIDTSVSARLATLKGILEFTETSTKLYLDIALVFADCDDHLLNFQEYISGSHANDSNEMLYSFKIVEFMLRSQRHLLLAASFMEIKTMYLTNIEVFASFMESWSSKQLGGKLLLRRGECQ
jgi:hypothetical protein